MAAAAMDRFRLVARLELLIPVEAVAVAHLLTGAVMAAPAS